MSKKRKPENLQDHRSGADESMAGIIGATGIVGTLADDLPLRERIALCSLVTQIVGFVSNERFAVTTAEEAEKQGIPVEVQLAITAVKHADALLLALKMEGTES